MIRTLYLALVTSCVAAAQPPQTHQPDVRLQVVPDIVYKVDDPGSTRTSSFVFDVAVLCSSDCALTPASASIELSHGRSIVERQAWTADQAASIAGKRYRILPETPIASPTRAFTLPEAFDLHFYMRVPRALAVDSADIRVTVADAKGGRAEHAVSIPIRTYEQKTQLSFPLRGKAAIGQDWITNGGHGGSWNAFAIDIRGLDQNYAEQLSDADDNAASPGWGREILAPAAGTVVYARSDVPTNPRPGQEPGNDWYKPLHDPVMAYAGNCVIIDHGNSEYSVMMHMQPGSIAVHVGDRVATGQVIGKLGNSGDAFGPHLHYQLQAGPRLFRDQPLPIKFQHIDVPLARGTYIDASQPR
jgi:hypothetical protein